jgi:L-ascorbate metabolism protein UlaG (beta-lactamase superfamily)
MSKLTNRMACLIMSVLLLAISCTVATGKIIYVDDDATGANDGSGWENAYVYLQDALADANSTEKPVEIRVAKGIYKPDQGTSQIPSDREATFHLISSVTLKGGYAGLNGPEPDTRDVALYETVLSGDLFGDDIQIDELEAVDLVDFFDEPTRAENSYHVIADSGTDDSAVLDGFTITAGNANGPEGSQDNRYKFQVGGGMNNISGSSTVVNCTFTKNSAVFGGGMNNMLGNPTIVNCTFSQNSRGGMTNDSSTVTLTNCAFTSNTMVGISNQLSSLTLTNCTFSENRGGGIASGRRTTLNLSNCTFIRNSADIAGGGMVGGTATLTNCTFIANEANQGGGLQSSSSTLTNCTFIGNKARYWGGGMRSGSDDVVSHCTFSGNSAEISGGAIVIGYNSDLLLTNCTLTGNWAQNGNAIASDNIGSDLFLSNLKVTNCIIWDKNNEIWNDDGSSITISYSDIQGGQARIYDPYDRVVIWGQGNIDTDPLFADPGYWADVNDPNVIVEPNNPNNALWVNGDYHLKSEAGRWDPVSESWVVDDVTSPYIDAGDPNNPVGDEPEPNGGRINMGAYGGTVEASKSPAGAEKIVYIQWLGHASVKVWTDDCIVYVDPQRLNISPHDATFVLVTHTHSDHYSPSDIARVSNTQTQFIAPPDVVQLYGSGLTIAPDQTIEFDVVTIKAVPAYNINKTNHPKSNNWVGYIIELGGKRIYVAGDTDLIEEMKSLGDIDVAFLPAGGMYTMNATEAAEATWYIKPDLAVPYHWGQIVGTLADAQKFVELARCPAMVMAVGETISSDNWPEYSPLIAHWTLDEAQGDIAHDSAGDNHGTLYGKPAWQPASGKINGALLLDGIDDYISTDFVLDPADGPFSVFAWIKGGAARQVVISQADGTGSGEIWLGADELLGRLMTGLVSPPAGRFVPQPLVSEFIITDGQWHHIGFVWDSSYRTLYADGAEVAKDTAAQNPLKSADGGLYIGAGKNIEAGTYFSGLIDDVRIYNVALTADEVETLVH